MMSWNDQEMSEEVVKAVKDKLLAAEEEHSRINCELDEFERVISVFKRLCKAREVKGVQFDDSHVLDSLIEECSTKLENIVTQYEGSTSLADVNFREWADEIEREARAQDNVMFSFDSCSSDEEHEEGKSQHGKSSRSKVREGSVSSKTGSTMLDILKSNGKMKVKNENDPDFEGRDERFFCLTTTAWALAVIGMMITIGFLTGDFLAARRDVAIRIERSEPTPLALPAVTICGDVPNIPTFVDYPTKEYPGLPLFGITSYVRLNRTGNTPHLELRYPFTLSNRSFSPFEEVVVATDGEAFRRAGRGFDVRRELSALHSTGNLGSFLTAGNKNEGFHCFRLGYRKREILQPFDSNFSTGVSVPALQVQVFKSRLLGACRTRFLRVDVQVKAAFASELLRHAAQLEERGILDFNGAEYSVLELNSFRYGDSSLFDFYCNVYFFSGYFYPSLDNPKISYRFNDSSGLPRWDKTGEGPYYSVFSWEAGSQPVIGPSLEVLEKDTYGFDSIRVYVEEAESASPHGYVSPDTGVSILDSYQTAIYTFRQVNAVGKTEFELKEGLLSSLTRTSFVSRFFVNMDYSTFEIEKIVASPTMSWSEFVTDVFEFVGLFTGICIFTLIVAPATSLV